MNNEDLKTMEDNGYGIDKIFCYLLLTRFALFIVMELVIVLNLYIVIFFCFCMLAGGRRCKRQPALSAFYTGCHTTKMMIQKMKLW